MASPRQMRLACCMIVSIVIKKWNVNISSFSSLTQWTCYTFMNQNVNKFIFKIKYFSLAIKRKFIAFSCICLLMSSSQRQVRN